MRILLDEDTPYPLRRLLPRHDVTSVPRMGWAGVKNGVLLGLVTDAGLDVFLTCDQNLEHQQTVTALPFGIVVFRVADKRMDTLRSLVPRLLALLASVEPERVYHVEPDLPPDEV